MNTHWASSNRALSVAPRRLAETGCLTTCQEFIKQISSIKENLLSKYGVASNGQEPILHSALKEAEALAWQTPYPHLLFPTLAEEKLRAARRWASLQGMARRKGWANVLAE